LVLRKKRKGPANRDYFFLHPAAPMGKRKKEGGERAERSRKIFASVCEEEKKGKKRRKGGSNQTVFHHAEKSKRRERREEGEKERE